MGVTEPAGNLCHTQNVCDMLVEAPLPLGVAQPLQGGHKPAVGQLQPLTSHSHSSGVAICQQQLNKDTHLIRLPQLLKPILGQGVVRVLVWMQPPCQDVVLLLDLLGGSIPRDTCSGRAQGEFQSPPLRLVRKPNSASST